MFYMEKELRELKPILSILDQLPNIDTYVIDGYCYLDESGKKGLGAYLHEEIDSRCGVIGVAKNPYKGSSHAAKLYRGRARNLFM